MSILHDFDQNEKSKIVKINMYEKDFQTKKNWAEFCEKKTFSNIARRLIYKKKQFYTSLKIRINIKVGN